MLTDQEQIEIAYGFINKGEALVLKGKNILKNVIDNAVDVNNKENDNHQSTAKKKKTSALTLEEKRRLIEKHR